MDILTNKISKEEIKNNSIQTITNNLINEYNINDIDYILNGTRLGDIYRWLQIWICQRRLHSYSNTKMENGEEEDIGRHTSKRSEVFQIPASSMRKLWGGIKWLGFPISHRAWTQRLLSHRIADQCLSL